MRIFISYSHRGNGPEWKAKLLKAMDVFERHYLLDIWQDGKIRVSSYWDDDIKQAMGSAHLAIILLTKEALESEYILSEEFPFLRERQQRDMLPIFPVVCEECNWREHDWLRATQSLNESNPLSQLNESAQDRVFRKLATDVAEELSRASLAEIIKPDQAPSPDHIYLDKFPITHSPGLREEMLIGREQELALLDLAFTQSQTAIVSFVAWGGVGKTMLVQHWLRRLEKGRIYKDDHCNPWFGARRVYAWSFYSQGTKEDRQASEDSFLFHALEWFGVKCEPTLSPWDKGRLLAEAVARERTMLILDGIELLQYPPGPMGGQLRAPGVQSMLKHLTRNANTDEHHGLCLVTTREPLTDLSDFQCREGSAWGSVLRIDLGNLTDEAGAALLHHVGTKRAGAAEIKPDDKELLTASREVDGHALTLNLLGRFLARAHGGDIRRRDLVKFEEADRNVQGGTTFKMLAAFENWFDKSGDFGARQLAVLRILGLFDRPADSGCIATLRTPPVINGLNDSLFTTRLDAVTGQVTVQPILEEDWNTATSFLADFDLIGIQANADNLERLIDCHPLVREHFAEQLREVSLDTWRLAHGRLFNHLKSSTENWPQTIEQMEPLYAAVAHGCRAERDEETFWEVLVGRIFRGTEGPEAFYSNRRLGAFGMDLSACACFFEVPWSSPSRSVSGEVRAWLLNQVALSLRALGRLTEAVEPMRSGGRLALESYDWENAAWGASTT